MTYHVDENGYYGEFGGAYIPEMLYPNTEELRQNYIAIMQDPTFRKEFDQLLRDYAGRPTPLYFAERLSNKYGCKIYLKREEECLAACCGAPMMMVDHHYHENLTPEKVDEVLDNLD